jgi:hypothetical protein
LTCHRQRMNSRLPRPISGATHSAGDRSSAFCCPQQGAKGSQQRDEKGRGAARGAWVSLMILTIHRNCFLYFPRYFNQFLSIPRTLTKNSFLHFLRSSCIVSARQGSQRLLKNNSSLENFRSILLHKRVRGGRQAAPSSAEQKQQRMTSARVKLVMQSDEDKSVM